MRFVLAIVSFIIAALCLGYCGLFVYGMAQYFRAYGFNLQESEVLFALAIGGSSFLIGIGFVVAGLLVLSSKSRGKQ